MKIKISMLFSMIFLFIAITATPLLAGDSLRCVRCGMIVAKNPTWEGRMQKPDEEVIVFCAPKCLLLTHPADKDHGGAQLQLRDYYSTNFIDATQAWYVGGSDIMGPMGPDLIPFVDKKSAKEFMAEHHGKALYRYPELTLAKLKEILPMKHHKKHKKQALDGSERCARCGMIIAEHPKWEGRMHKKGEERVLFCAPRCLLMTNPADKDSSGTKLKLRDYYSTDLIDARAAWFVAGSDVMGPMGPDLIPFADKKSAKEFMAEHHGKALYRYSELTLAKLKEILPMKHHKKQHEKQ